MAESALGIAVTVGLSVFSWFAGMAAAGGQQDREQLRRQRGVARALLADLSRIEQAIDGAGIGLHLVEIARDVHTEMPTIHPWVVGIVAQIADSSSEVVSRLMSLEQALALASACAHSVERQYGLIGEIADRIEALGPEGRLVEFDGGSAFIPAAPGSNPQSAHKATAARLDRELQDVRDAFPPLRELLSKAEAKVADDIGALRAALQPIAEAAIPSLASMVMRQLIPMPEDQYPKYSNPVKPR